MKLAFKLTTSAPGRKDKQVFVVVYVKGTDKRAIYADPKLKHAPLDNWDKTKQRFMGGTHKDAELNDLLYDLAERCRELINNPAVTTPKQVVDALRSGVAPKPVMTLGDFIESYIDEQRKKPTCNYQLYLTLWRNLMGERHNGKKIERFEKPAYNGVALIDTDITKIDNAHLAAFAKWVMDVKGGKNYKNLNASLHHIMSVAVERGASQLIKRYDYHKDAPQTITTDAAAEASKALTVSQFNEIVAMSGKVINPKGHRNRELQPLYLDVALLMYYTMSRPADVLLFRYDMISTTANGTKVLRYIPYKKRTYRNAAAHTVTIPICDEAWKIIKKYKRSDTGGYLLPFPMNRNQWDITTTEGNKAWRSASNAVEGNVNAHLKKIGAMLGLEFGLTLNAFRRSAITHTIERGEVTPQVAKRAGTSIAMIDKHYYKDMEY